MSLYWEGISSPCLWLLHTVLYCKAFSSSLVPNCIRKYVISLEEKIYKLFSRLLFSLPYEPMKNYFSPGQEKIPFKKLRLPCLWSYRFQGLRFCSSKPQSLISLKVWLLNAKYFLFFCYTIRASLSM